MAALTTRHKQRGESLLFTLVTLLILLLGFLYTMRHTLLDISLTGNNLQRQKDVQVSDVALRNLEQQIAAVYSSQPLEISASTQAWYRDVAPGTPFPGGPGSGAAPSASYWASCVGSSSASARCGVVSVASGSTVLPYTAMAVVQPTGRTDANACGLPQFRAIYYDIFLRVTETSGATSAVTETVYKLCTLS